LFFVLFSSEKGNYSIFRDKGQVVCVVEKNALVKEALSYAVANMLFIFEHHISSHLNLGSLAAFLPCEK